MSLNRSQQAEYRPLVKAAWLAQCALTGVSPNNRQAYETWYREQLWAACRIRTSSDATEGQYRHLLKRFSMLARGGGRPELEGVSEAQNGLFSSLVEKAWQAVCRRHAQPLNFPEWLDAELEQCGITGRKVTDRVDQFDRILAHFAVVAGDERMIDRMAKAAERRIRFLLGRRMEELSKITGECVTWEYCRSIYQHMNLPLTMEEADARWLLKVLQALDTHLRRLKNKQPACTE